MNTSINGMSKIKENYYKYSLNKHAMFFEVYSLY